MNYFTPKSTAERYARGRPYFHLNTVGKIQKKLNLKEGEQLNRILDIACGTGLSTKALRGIGKEVIGTDSSDEMILHAKEIEGIHIVKSFAEKQPFENEYFDLITVSSGIHWFDIDNFLRECVRLLKPETYLVIYDNFFISEMLDEPDFKNWFPNIYLNKYPSPPRNNRYDWSPLKLNRIGLDLVEEEKFKNQVSFSKKEFVLYLTTQSNITAEVSSNKSSYADIEHWLNGKLHPFFNNESQRRVFDFGNWVKYLKKI